MINRAQIADTMLMVAHCQECMIVQSTSAVDCKINGKGFMRVIIDPEKSLVTECNRCRRLIPCKVQGGEVQDAEIYFRTRSDFSRGNYFTK